jgi:hypothetical protein
METSLILSKRISYCPNIRAKSYRIITLFEALNSIRTQVYEKQVANIRELSAKGNIASCRAKKKQLPAFVFSGILFDTRHKFDISGYTSLLIIDIDKLDDLEAAISVLKSDIHVISVWRSPSGNGLKALIYLEYTDAIENENIWIVHEHCAFPQVSNYLAEKYGINIDKTGADITQMCFVTSDPQIHLKREFEPFQVIPNLDKKQIWEIRAKYNYGRKDVRKAITEMKRIARQNIADKSNIAIGTDSEVPEIDFADNQQTTNKCNELSHILSRVCLLINSIEYVAAEQLLQYSQELLKSENYLTSDETSRIHIKNLTDYFAEILSFLTYLKSLQENPEIRDEDLIFETKLLPTKLKTTSLNNLRNKKRFQNIIYELKHNITINDINKRTTLIGMAKFLIGKGFRGAGCSSLRKWARQQLSAIES